MLFPTVVCVLQRDFLAFSCPFNMNWQRHRINLKSRLANAATTTVGKKFATLCNFRNEKCTTRDCSLRAFCVPQIALSKKEPQWDSLMLFSPRLETGERGNDIVTHCVWLNAVLKSNGFNEQTLCQNWQRRLGSDTAPFIPIIDEDDVFNAVLNE